MNNHRCILSFVLATGAVLSIAVDWNTTHLFNPTWPPHAVFHDWARGVEAAGIRLERAGVAMRLVGHKTESIYRPCAVASENDLPEAEAPRGDDGGRSGSSSRS